MDKDVRKIIGGVFNQIAEGLETGSFAGKIRVGLTTLGSELGDKELIRGAEMARQGIRRWKWFYRLLGKAT